MHIYALRRRNRLCTHSVPREMHFAINTYCDLSQWSADPTGHKTKTGNQGYCKGGHPL